MKTVASTLWYPLTFLLTDIVSEIYGARRARLMVVLGFSMSLVLLGASLVGIALPTADVYPLGDDYRNIFSPVGRLLFGSMAAFRERTHHQRPRFLVKRRYSFWIPRHFCLSARWADPLCFVSR